MKKKTLSAAPSIDQVVPGTFYQYTGQKGSLLICRVKTLVYELAYGERLVALSDETQAYSGEKVIETAKGFLPTHFFTPVETTARLVWKIGLFRKYRASRKILSGKKEIQEYLWSRGWSQNRQYYRIHVYMDEDFIIEEKNGQWYVEEAEFDYGGTFEECENYLFERMIKAEVGLLELNRPFLDMNSSKQEKPSEKKTFENWLIENEYVPFRDGRPRWSKGYASFGADELYDRFLDSENHPHHEGQ